MIYLYGLIEPGDSQVDIGPIEGLSGPVSFADCSGLTLIYGNHDGGEILPRRRHLLRHARVLETALGLGTVLPMRFGMLAASPCDVAARLAARRAAVDCALARVRGHVELGVRVSVPEPVALATILRELPDLARARDRLAQVGAAGHFETAAFGRRLGEALAQRRTQAQKQLLRGLRSLAADHVLGAPSTDFELLRAEFLVADGAVRAFQDGLAELVKDVALSGETAADVQMVGPGPAYHFVDLSLDQAPGEAAA